MARIGGLEQSHLNNPSENEGRIRMGQTCLAMRRFGAIVGSNPTPTTPQNPKVK